MKILVPEAVRRNKHSMHELYVADVGGSVAEEGVGGTTGTTGTAPKPAYAYINIVSCTAVSTTPTAFFTSKLPSHRPNNG